MSDETDPRFGRECLNDWTSRDGDDQPAEEGVVGFMEADKGGALVVRSLYT